jgi:hypothetical protein
MRLMLTAALAALTAVPPAWGEDDFTFRRVRVGDSQPGQRITVQIDPAEQAARLAALPAATPWRAPDDPVTAPEAGAATPGATPPSASYAWFWDLVPPGLGQSADRFTKAVASLSQGPGGASVRAPRL